MTYKVIAFILAYKNPPLKVIKCLKKQTLKPGKIVIVAAYPSACIDESDIDCIVVPPPKDKLLTVGERIGIALTIAFNTYNLENYDYFLKIDDDVEFNENFIEENIKAGYVLMGRGCAMIIKVPWYLKIWGKTWPIATADDTSVVVSSIPFNSLPWKYVNSPKMLRPINAYFKRLWKAGYDLYRVGYPAIYLLKHAVIKLIRERDIQKIPVIMGYIAALIVKPRKRKQAEIVEKYMKKRLINRLKKRVMSIALKTST